MKTTKEDLKSYDQDATIGFIDGSENVYNKISDINLWLQLAKEEILKDNDNWYFSFWMIDSIQNKDCPLHIYEGFLNNVIMKQEK